MRDQAKPLSYTELMTFREQRPIIPEPQDRMVPAMDWSNCGLARTYGMPGEVYPDALARTSRRRRVLRVA